MTAQLDTRRVPGSAAGNQYGTFEVHYGTPAQIKYATRLAAERDTTGLHLPEDFGKVNKRALSDWIDTLITRAEVKGPNARPTTADGVTDKQLAFIKKLAAEKDWEDLASPSDGSIIRHALNDAVTAISRREASSVIDWMVTLARKPYTVPQRSEGSHALEDAIYRNPETGEIFKVYHTVHGANEQVAKILKVLPEAERYTKVVRGKEVEVRAEFEYMGKRGLRGLTPEMKMSLEEAKQFGAVYGVCVRCAATLTNEVSIEAAMGPVCRSKF